MGEVVEINIISTKSNLLYDLLDFISLQMIEDIVETKIEIMDNWCYENVEEVESINLIEKFLDCKIVCINESRRNGYSGLNIEKTNNRYTYSMWFNFKPFLSNDKYIQINRDYINYMLEKNLLDKIIIGAIGKEIKFEDYGDIKKIINKSYNIDTWIISNCYNIKGYEVMNNYFKSTSREVMFWSKLKEDLVKE